MIFKHPLEARLDAKIQQFNRAAFSSNTIRTYEVHRKSYMKFCSLMGYVPVPAPTEVICRYVAWLSEKLCYGSIKQYLNIIRIMHLELGYKNPLLEDFKLTSVLRGVRRTLGDSVTRKEPITPNMLTAVLRALNLDNLRDSAIWAAATVAFFGMLRRSNVTPASVALFDPSRHLRRKDVVLLKECVQVTIRWSKTNQFRNRVLTLPLPRIAGHPLCPFSAVARHFELTRFAADVGPAFVTNSGPLVTDEFIKTIKQVLTQQGYDASSISGHSFRRGGATFAFQCGVPTLSIKHMGDWVSDCYQIYTLDSTSSLSRHYQEIARSVSQL